MPKALVDEMIAKEYMGSGKASMEEKVMRRDERSLGSTLVPRSQPPRAPFRPGGEARFDRPRPSEERQAERSQLISRGAQQSRPAAANGESQERPFVRQPADQDRPKHVFEKKQVNIDDLKKSIEESLQKRKQAEPEERPAEQPKDIEGEVHE